MDRVERRPGGHGFINTGGKQKNNNILNIEGDNLTLIQKQEAIIRKVRPYALTYFYMNR